MFSTVKNQRLSIGDKVNVKNKKKDSWKTATITHLHPLKAIIDGQSTSSAWSYIRCIEENRMSLCSDEDMGQEMMNQLNQDENAGNCGPVDVNLILAVCERVLNVFKKEGALLELKAKKKEQFVVLGDIHGQHFDMVRILEILDDYKMEISPKTKNRYLFLGDYVDRGDHSLEVILWLFNWKLLAPKSIYLLRGNHETRSINKKYGFYSQIIDIYGEEDGKTIYEAINNVFDYMPIAATLNHKYFCVHGGLSPKLKDLDTLREIKLPIRDPRIGTLVNDILWSDPCQTNEVTEFELNKNRGPVFGKDAVTQFLSRTGLQGIIRAHEVANDGFWTACDDLVVTLFSAPHYKNVLTNKAAALIVKKKKRTLLQFTKIKTDSSIYLSHIIHENSVESESEKSCKVPITIED